MDPSIVLTDELSGTYNLDGFTVLAEHHMAMADRRGQPVLLVFIGLDGLSAVRERNGSEAADRLVADSARVLKMVVRRSDVLARVGDDQFCVLLTGDAAGAETMVLARLVEAIASDNARSERPSPLSLSVGTATYDPAEPCPLPELIAQAGLRMEERRKAAGGPTSGAG